MHCYWKANSTHLDSPGGSLQVGDHNGSDALLHTTDWHLLGQHTTGRLVGWANEKLCEQEMLLILAKSYLHAAPNVSDAQVQATIIAFLRVEVVVDVAKGGESEHQPGLHLPRWGH